MEMSWNFVSPEKWEPCKYNRPFTSFSFAHFPDILRHDLLLKLAQPSTGLSFAFTKWDI